MDAAVAVAAAAAGVTLAAVCNALVDNAIRTPRSIRTGTLVAVVVAVAVDVLLSSSRVHVLGPKP